MKVLSLFDGISCARVALERAGIPVEVYYASEIDKYAIQISKKKYSEIRHLGDVKDLLKNRECGEVFTLNSKNIHSVLNHALFLFDKNHIDLLIGGSPCQDLSIAKKDRKGLSGERSGLFWEYVRILKEIKPTYFILENVASMPKEAKDLITKTLGVEPIMINAALVSAQNRKRLFWVGRRRDWTNEKDGTYSHSDYVTVAIDQPTDRFEYLKDILIDGENEIIKNSWKYKEGKPREYIGKCPTLSANMGTAGGHVPLTRKDNRKLTPIECERLQGLPEIEKSCIIRVCLGNQNNHANVVDQNLKLQKSAGNVEKIESKVNVISAKKNLNIKRQQRNNVVQPDVVISCVESGVEILSHGKLLANVSGVELKQSVHHLKQIDDFVRLIVGLNTIVEKITITGKEELLQKNNHLAVIVNGKNVVSLYGKEMTQLANDVKNDITTLNKLLKSITSDHSIQENKEQIVQILFSYVANVILGYIPKEILNQNTLIFQIKSKVGYTWDVSNTQRYKALGNAFNVDVVAHILSFIK